MLWQEKLQNQASGCPACHTLCTCRDTCHAPEPHLHRLLAPHSPATSQVLWRSPRLRWGNRGPRHAAGQQQPPTSEPCLVLSPSSYRVQKQRGERATWGGRPPALLTLGPQPSFSASVPSSGRPAFSSLGLCFARRLGKRQRPPLGRACQLTGPVTEAGPSPARQPRHSPPPAWTDAPALVREGTLGRSSFRVRSTEHPSSCLGPFISCCGTFQASRAAPRRKRAVQGLGFTLGSGPLAGGTRGSEAGVQVRLPPRLPGEAALPRSP